MYLPILGFSYRKAFHSNKTWVSFSLQMLQYYLDKVISVVRSVASRKTGNSRFVSTIDQWIHEILKRLLSL